MNLVAEGEGGRGEGGGGGGEMWWFGCSQKDQEPKTCHDVSEMFYPSYVRASSSASASWCSSPPLTDALPSEPVPLLACPSLAASHLQFSFSAIQKVNKSSSVMCRGPAATQSRTFTAFLRPPRETTSHPPMVVVVGGSQGAL